MIWKMEIDLMNSYDGSEACKHIGLIQLTKKIIGFIGNTVPYSQKIIVFYREYGVILTENNRLYREYSDILKENNRFYSE